jgi:hypothetical protein
MCSWLRTDLLDGDLLIIASSRSGSEYGDWRHLRDVNNRRRKSTASSGNHTYPTTATTTEKDVHGGKAVQWVFVDEDGLQQGPCDHSHMHHWWKEGTLHPQTWIATANKVGDRVGTWRTLDKLLDPIVDSNDAEVQKEGGGKRRTFGIRSISKRFPSLSSKQNGPRASSGKRASLVVYENHFFTATDSIRTSGTAVDPSATSRDSSSDSSSDAADENDEIDDDGSISPAVLASILSPGIKPSDLHSMIRKFGHRVKEEEEEAVEAQNPPPPRRKRGPIGAMKHRAMKRQLKRDRMRRRARMGLSQEEWRRYVDVKRGEVFYINSVTL